MKRKILLVDDNQAQRASLEKVLSTEYELLPALNTPEALYFLKRRANTISAVLLEAATLQAEDYALLRKIRDCALWAQIPIFVIAPDEQARLRVLSLGANGFLPALEEEAVLLSFLRNNIHLCETAAIMNTFLRDKLTGIYNRETFLKEAGKLIARRKPGHYVLACFDIVNFKIINDQYSVQTGDAVLCHVAACISQCVQQLDGICCRYMADKFAVLYPACYRHSKLIADCHHESSIPPNINRSIKIRIGRYIIDDLSLPVSAMYDRAMLAQESIRGRYDLYIAEYTEFMRRRLLDEQQIVTQMHDALQNGQLELWLQPQYNHKTGCCAGAEALARWRHPERGVIVPGQFIPIFEQNGFIYELDRFIWECACALLRRWLDEGKSPLPISVNVSRYDFFQPDFFATIMSITDKYRLPRKLLRLEITESAFAESAEQIIAVIERLREAGFVISIDDFGSGYSSLNILKDVPADVLKLDMRFLENNRSARGGRILESVIRMAKWLDMPVLAEGVETIAQADYLLSLGCELMQGHLFAKAMPVEEYLESADAGQTDRMSQLETIAFLGEDAFWNPNSIETMVFNHFSGGACVCERFHGQLELLRVNAEFAKAFRSELPEKEILRREPFSALSPEERNRLLAAMEKAAVSKMPQTTEFYSTLYSEQGGEYIRLTVRLIASNHERQLFYAYVENITAQRLAEQGREQANKHLRFLNDMAHVMLKQPDPELGIRDTLHRLLEYFHGNRAYIFEFDFDCGIARNTYEVCAPGVSEERENLQKVPLSMMSVWLDALRKHNYIHLPKVDALLDDRREERETLQAQGIKSLIAIALTREGKLFGLLGIDDGIGQLSLVNDLVALGDYIAVMFMRRNRKKLSEPAE